MPQLVAFYFINEVTFSFFFFVINLYILSKYSLPKVIRLFVCRIYIYKI
jgi:F-type H+-transporting ATPase subunit 8